MLDQDICGFLLLSQFVRWQLLSCVREYAPLLLHSCSVIDAAARMDTLTTSKRCKNAAAMPIIATAAVTPS